MAATRTAAPWRVSREATQPIRSMFVSRSSFEKPRPFERWVRMASPSRYSTRCPRRSSSGPTICAIVVLPAPESPVNHRVKPLDTGAASFSVSFTATVSVTFSVFRTGRNGRVLMDPALELVRAGPAARPLLLPWLGRPRARNAADRAVARVVERVVRDLVDRDVRVQALLV